MSQILSRLAGLLGLLMSIAQRREMYDLNVGRGGEKGRKKKNRKCRMRNRLTIYIFCGIEVMLLDNVHLFPSFQKHRIYIYQIEFWLMQLQY